MNISKMPLLWLRTLESATRAKMFPQKLQRGYQRPNKLDTFAKQAIVAAERSTCLFYAVGAVIFTHDVAIASGYNGPARGDVDPRIAGCARVKNGVVQEGKDLCRGAHAELNAINNLTVSTLGMDDLNMMVTLHPCKQCAKQIVNKGITTVYYLWAYGREDHVTAYLRDSGVRVIKYRSTYLIDWIRRVGFCPAGALCPREP